MSLLSLDQLVELRNFFNEHKTREELRANLVFIRPTEIQHRNSFVIEIWKGPYSFIIKGEVLDMLKDALKRPILIYSLEAMLETEFDKLKKAPTL